MTSALALLALLVPAGSALGQASFPDLVADPPGDGELQVYSRGGAARLLLRFDAFIHNRGAGLVEIRGSNRTGAVMSSVVQRISGLGEERSRARVIFESEDEHYHWHLEHAARYSLWNVFRTAEVAPAMKVGFCLEDSERVDGHAPWRPTYTDRAISFCQQGSPQTASVEMGISPGWRDVYDRSLAFQWVDVSSVSPGIYWLRSEVDPDNVVRESDEANAPSFGARASIVPGYVAQPVARSLAPGRPTAIELGARSFGSVGGVQYRIDSTPSCGTLDRPAGTWLASPTVTYTPRPGCQADGFRYSARDATSPFPLSPVSAAVSLTRPLVEGVSISGAPGELATGQSAQLSAAVSNGPPGVSWSVDGAAGGNARVGTITPAGRYRAPAKVPPGSYVRVGARSRSGAAAEVRIKVVPAPALRPAISPRARVVRRGRLVYVRTVPRRSGRIWVGVRQGRRTVASCRPALVRARRAYACRARVRRGVALRNLRVVVTIRVRGRIVGAHTTRVPGGPAHGSHPH